MKEEEYYGLFREIKKIMETNYEKASYSFSENSIELKLSSNSMNCEMFLAFAKLLDKYNSVKLINVDLYVEVSNNENLNLSFYISED